MRTSHGLRLASALVVLATGIAACGGGSTTEVAAGDPGAGASSYAANCAACHGAELEGTQVGPPLVHEIYEPSHHSDEAFRLAIAEGVAAHHWEFGPMPAIGGLTDQDVADIIAHVRAEQRAAGID